MNGIGRMVVAIARSIELDYLRAAADIIAQTREPYWRWSVHLAAAILARKNGLA